MQYDKRTQFRTFQQDGLVLIHDFNTEVTLSGYQELLLNQVVYSHTRLD